jgi:hypothetical protein
LWLGVWQKLAVICPRFEPKSYQMTSVEPINFMLFHTIISWHVQMMMIINGFGAVIWLTWVMLGQICGCVCDKNWLWFAQDLSQNPTRWHP